MEMSREDLRERDALIQDIISLGKNYQFHKYTNAQLWNIKNKLIAQQRKDLEVYKANLAEMKKQQEEKAKQAQLFEARFTEIQNVNNQTYFQDNTTGQLSFFRPTEDDLNKPNKRGRRR